MKRIKLALSRSNLEYLMEILTRCNSMNKIEQIMKKLRVFKYSFLYLSGRPLTVIHIGTLIQGASLRYLLISLLKKKGKKVSVKGIMMTFENKVDITIMNIITLADPCHPCRRDCSSSLSTPILIVNLYGVFMLQPDSAIL